VIPKVAAAEHIFASESRLRIFHHVFILASYRDSHGRPSVMFLQYATHILSKNKAMTLLALVFVVQAFFAGNRAD